MKTKILIISPHLSTGGAPQFTLNKIENLLIDNDVHCIEYNYISSHYTVQRNKIVNLLGDNFHSLQINKLLLIELVNQISPDVVFLEEIGESFMNEAVLNFIYRTDRSYKLFETTHSSIDTTYSKKYFPDKFIFVSEYSKRMYSKFDIPSEVIEYPIIPKDKDQGGALKKLKLDVNYTHVLNVGLFTPGKNQEHIINIARMLENEKIIFHFVGNQAPNFKEYWEPLMTNLPRNCRIWGEINDVETFYQAADLFLFPSKFELNPIVIKEALSYNLPILMFNLETYVGKYDANPNIEFITGNLYQDSKILLKALNMENDNLREKYQSLIGTPKKSTLQFNINFVNGPFVEILGKRDGDFKIEFINQSNSEILYETTIKSNSWARCNFKYFIDWKINIYENGELIASKLLTFKDQRVYIAFDSSSLGDTIAWIPYVQQFKEKHDCHVIVSTFKNFLFEAAYPELEFVAPGDVVENIEAQYTLGWFYDKYKEPVLPNTIPLQQTATNILGLPYKEQAPNITYKGSENVTDKDLITIAPNSTAGCKEWPIEYWQELVDYLVGKGYDVVNVSKEPNQLRNVIHYDEKLENVIYKISLSKLFIGLSSGLSWLSWAVGTHVVMISNFTKPDHEFTSNCTRIVKKDVCHGCWNNPNFKFDKGDWNWCPINKGTDKQFECHTSITPDIVIAQIQHLL
jgi:autotransporter strand-loop-strand O-heptosyltransferase